MEENIGITSITINSLHLSNNLLSSLCSHITQIERDSPTQCILLNNSSTTSILTNSTNQTDLKCAKDCLRELGKRSIPIVTCLRERVCSLLFELAMSGDIRVWHESAWMEPMLDICLVKYVSDALKSLHKRDPRADRRSRAYKLLKKSTYFGARDAVKFGLGDVCIPMHEDCYQAGLEICRGIVVRETAHNPSPH